MISDDDLYRLAIFLGSAAMLLIILYHFLEINAVEEPVADSKVEASPSFQKDTKYASSGR
jgi:oligosaccharyl transferase complex subunit OST4